MPQAVVPGQVFAEIRRGSAGSGEKTRGSRIYAAFDKQLFTTFLRFDKMPAGRYQTPDIKETERIIYEQEKRKTVSLDAV